MKEQLIAEVMGAYRPYRAGVVSSHSAWHDLDDAEREEAFLRTEEIRRFEAALADDGRTSTANVVLASITENAE